jgi:hypothetical protein
MLDMAMREMRVQLWSPTYYSFHTLAKPKLFFAVHMLSPPKLSPCRIPVIVIV